MTPSETKAQSGEETRTVPILCGPESSNKKQCFHLPLTKGALEVSFPVEMTDVETEEVLGMMTMITKRLRRQVKSAEPAGT